MTQSGHELFEIACYAIRAAGAGLAVGRQYDDGALGFELQRTIQTYPVFVARSASHHQIVGKAALPYFGI
jgi:hypothetical protein